MHDRPDKAENTLYIGDLEEGITEEQLYVEFRKFGTIKYLKLHRYLSLPLYAAILSSASPSTTPSSHIQLKRKPKSLAQP